MAAVARVLKPTGLCYFAGPNKYSLIEPHYQVPLLSWCPPWLANYYVRWLGVADQYAIRPYSLPSMRHLLADFAVIDYRAAVVAEPTRYAVDDLLPPGSIKQRLARWVLQWLPYIFPDFVLVLRKRAIRDE
jgi:hypothetical protein